MVSKPEVCVLSEEVRDLVHHVLLHSCFRDQESSVKKILDPLFAILNDCVDAVNSESAVNITVISMFNKSVKKKSSVPHPI